jgi:hypothetical protein
MKSLIEMKWMNNSPLVQESKFQVGIFFDILEIIRM